MKMLNGSGAVQIIASGRHARVQRFSRSGRVFSPPFIGATFDGGFEIHFGPDWKYLYVYPSEEAGEQALSYFASATPMPSTGLWGGEWFNGYVRNFVTPIKVPM